MKGKDIVKGEEISYSIIIKSERWDYSPDEITVEFQMTIESPWIVTGHTQKSIHIAKGGSSSITGYLCPLKSGFFPLPNISLTCNIPGFDYIYNGRMREIVVPQDKREWCYFVPIAAFHE